jgi:hypothetical protein
MRPTHNIFKLGLCSCAEANRDFYLLAQNLVFHNSDLDKSTNVCKVGDLEGVCLMGVYLMGIYFIYESS